MIAAALKNWRPIVTGLALVTLGLLLVLAKADARHWRKVAGAEKAAHAQTVTNYRAAAVQAELADKTNVLRVKNAQAAITERITDAHQSDMAVAAARYERLRTQAAAYSRSPPAPDASAAREATCRAYAGTSCDQIPPLLKAAQDNTDQLLAFQAWAREQAALDFNDAPHQ
jgi:hypothetical protein